MYHDQADAQMLTERTQRGKVYGDGNDERGGGIHRDVLLTPMPPLPEAQTRRAMRRVAEHAYDVVDGRELLDALGLLEVTT